MEANGCQNSLENSLLFLENVIGNKGAAMHVPFRAASNVIFDEGRESTDVDITEDMARSLIAGMDSSESLTALHEAPPSILGGLISFAYQLADVSTIGKELTGQLNAKAQFLATSAKAKANSVTSKAMLASAWIQSNKRNVPRKLALQFEVLQGALTAMIDEASAAPDGIEKISKGAEDGYASALGLAEKALAHAPKAVVDGFAAPAIEMARRKVVEHAAVAEVARHLVDSVKERRDDFHAKAGAATAWIQNVYSASMESSTIPDDPEFNKKLLHILQSLSAMDIKTFQNGLAEVSDDVIDGYAHALASCASSPRLLSKASADVQLGLTLYGDDLVQRSRKHTARFAELVVDVRKAIQASSSARGDPGETKRPSDRKANCAAKSRRGRRVLSKSSKPTSLLGDVSPSAIMAALSAPVVALVTTLAEEIEDAFGGCWGAPAAGGSILTAIAAGVLVAALLRLQHCVQKF